jgi:hypothetical protein
MAMQPAGSADEFQGTLDPIIFRDAKLSPDSSGRRRPRGAPI